MSETAGMEEVEQPLEIPEAVTREWVRAFGERLLRETWRGQAAFRSVLTPQSVIEMLQRATALAKDEPTLVDVMLFFPSLRQEAPSRHQRRSQVRPRRCRFVLWRKARP